jgi:hypothetical protein
MLDAWIIEELKRQEEKKIEQEKPFLELPIPEPEECEEEIKEEAERGVIKIQL